ncbi:hypothetical protein [Ectobacillus ponti]|uniref:Uncharacterized protein n=1 Tax=Ectobacillus ponti TaxID=2961894 RepID=A0AA41XC26_9BACI|nr:hypothetical protein [Ectobacillus ponti]MCP8970594.1 hypothetical protein [Ectobacillus ponti]
MSTKLVDTAEAYILSAYPVLQPSAVSYRDGWLTLQQAYEEGTYTNRYFLMPDIDEDGIQTSSEKDILTVILPKR